MKLALLHNPRSGYNRRHPERVPHAAREAGIPLWEINGQRPLESLMREVAATDPDVLVINAGDGTVDSVVTCLRRTRGFAREPMLAILPGGTTNMIARDVGLRGRPERSLKRLARAAASGTPGVRLQRAPLCVRADGLHEHERLGFFLGGGALPAALREVQHGLHARNLVGRGGESLALVQALGRLLFGDVQRDPVFAPRPVRWLAETRGDAEPGEQAAVFYFVTTLDRLVLGMRPGEVRPNLRFLALRYPYRRLLMSLPGLLAGRAFNRLGDNFVSRTADRLVLEFSGEAVLDGEPLALPHGATRLEIALDEPLAFWRP